MPITALLLLALSQSTPVAPGLSDDPKTVRILCLGDDWAAVRRGAPAPWPSRLEAMLEEKTGGALRFEVENVAKAGGTTVEGLRRLNRDVLMRDPDVLVLHYGFADSALDPSLGQDFPAVAPGAYRSNLVDLATASRGQGIEVIFVQQGARVWTEESRKTHATPPFNPGHGWGLDVLGGAYAAAMQEVAAQLELSIVPLHGADALRPVKELVVERDASGQLPSAELSGRIAQRVSAAIAAMDVIQDARPLSSHRAPSRGWTIPELDLAGEVQRQVVVDREPGQYLGHPSTLTLKDGSILCAYPKGHGRGPVVMKRSQDGGRSWGERLEVPASWATSKETPTLYRVPRPDGEGDRLVMWSGLFPARRALSEDEGATWGELEVPGPGDPWGGIVVMGDQLTFGAERTVAWFHDDGRFLRESRGPAGFGVFQVETRDGGATWSQPREIVRWPHGHLCEPGVVQQGDTVALLLRENSRRRNSQVVVSRDGGATWEKPRPLAGALTGDRHQALWLPDGRLFVSFRDMGLDSPRRGDWVAWVGSFEDLLAGRQGDLRIRIMDNLKGTDCAYPALEWTEDGHILAVTYGHWTRGEQPWIAGVRIHPEEL